MNPIRGARFRRRAVATTAAVSAMLMFTATAANALDDNFQVATRDANTCGVADFVDYGPGAPGGGNNDDYIVIHDYCADGHGVRAYVWIMGEYWDDRYNGNGLAGAPVVWDPFRDWGGPDNLVKGDFFTIMVCLVDGPNDGADNPSEGSWCRSGSHTMKDG
jgi:hypothetical protein